MQIASLLPFLLAAISVQALPLDERGVIDDVGVLDDVLLFDAPAFPDPANPGKTIASIQAFVSLRQADLGFFTATVESALNAIGVKVGNKISTLEDRIKLLGAVGLPGKNVQVNVGGCDTQAKLPRTALRDLGITLSNVTLGTCGAGKQLAASVVVPSVDSRKFTSTIFSSPNSGFGVISDIDDTVKVSNVLDKLALARSTLLDAPKAVTGMPELYASLAKSLDNPQFVYVSGSPFQLYPFLNNFINTAYSASKGPILLQNLTLIDVQGLLDFARSDGVQEYKVSMIDRLHGMYPNKKFLAVGDSTQKDPETYAEAFKKYGGDFMTCSWIRRVEGADNSDARFAKAFAGVPDNKFRIFTDAEIPALQNINVAGGEC